MTKCLIFRNYKPIQKILGQKVQLTQYNKINSLLTKYQLLITHYDIVHRKDKWTLIAIYLELLTKNLIAKTKI